MIDLEVVFCCIVFCLWECFDKKLSEKDIFDVVVEIIFDIVIYGVFNFIMLNGYWMIVCCLIRFYYVICKVLFSKVLCDDDVEIDFSKYIIENDKVIIIVM